jgi:2-oxoglutarate ferredoxin oxidoreductase subunit gamma
MRGGTANCSVCLSDEPIGSPLVLSPDCLVAMNNPSYDRFIDSVVPGGVAVIDSTLVDRACGRTDITAVFLPATQTAKEHDLQGLANIILLGALLEKTGFTTPENLEACFRKIIPAKKAPKPDRKEYGSSSARHGI